MSKPPPPNRWRKRQSEGERADVLHKAAMAVSYSADAVKAAAEAVERLAKKCKHAHISGFAPIEMPSED